MNKINYGTNGGMPITQDHLAFMQDGVTEAIKGLLLGLATSGAKGYILRGCTTYASGGNLWINEGYCVIQFANNAEIFYVPNHDLGVPSNTTGLYWKLVETNAAPSPVTFKDQSSQNIHKQRRLTLATTTTNFYPLYSETPALIDHLGERLGAIDTVYQVGNANAAAWQNGNGGLLRYYKDKLGNVHLFGYIEPTTVDSPILTMPAGFRPGYIIYQNVVAKELIGVATESKVLQLSTDGNLSWAIEPSTGLRYYFGMLIYKTV